MTTPKTSKKRLDQGRSRFQPPGRCKVSCAATHGKPSRMGVLADAEAIPASNTSPDPSLSSCARTASRHRSSPPHTHRLVHLVSPRSALFDIRPVSIPHSANPFLESHEGLFIVQKASCSVIDSRLGLTSLPRDSYVLSGIRSLRLPFVLPFRLAYYTGLGLITPTTCSFTTRPVLTISCPRSPCAHVLSAVSYVPPLALPVLLVVYLTFDVLGRPL
jgi:hypothetical protein